MSPQWEREFLPIGSELYHDRITHPPFGSVQQMVNCIELALRDWCDRHIVPTNLVLSQFGIKRREGEYVIIHNNMARHMGLLYHLHEELAEQENKPLAMIKAAYPLASQALDAADERAVIYAIDKCLEWYYAEDQVAGKIKVALERLSSAASAEERLVVAMSVAEIQHNSGVLLEDYGNVPRKAIDKLRNKGLRRLFTKKQINDYLEGGFYGR